MSNPTFHLGLTMAGAISGGSYTGGAMDYMLQVMDRWQLIKDTIDKHGKDPNSLSEEELKIFGMYGEHFPTHDVRIEVMGGASAGGMTTSMALLAAYRKFNPITSPTDDGLNRTGNVFYDNWVLLRDEQGRKTIEKLFENNDLDDGPVSAVNSDFIDELADEAFTQTGDIDPADCRKYMNPDHEMILTLTSLRGIDLKIDFDKVGKDRPFEEVPGHVMQQHSIKAHFKVGASKTDVEFLPLAFDNNEQVKLWRDCTVATGAFPFGLRSREITLSGKYVKKEILRSVLGSANADPEKLRGVERIPDEFRFTAVDGGTLNNEPFGEVKAVLDRITGRKEDDTSPFMHGIIMIDPFPNFNIEEKEHEFKKDILDLPGPLYSTLREQAMLKGKELASTGKYTDFPLYEIYPSKRTAWGDEGKVKYPLACGSVGAFGGFLDIQFRIHDFFLGRNNCKNLLRYFCVLEESHPLFQHWNDEYKKRYRVTRNGKTYLPIIPDPFLVDEGKQISDPIPPVPEYDIPDLPKYDPNELFDLKISGRLTKLQNSIVDAVFDLLVKEDEQGQGQDQVQENNAPELEDNEDEERKKRVNDLYLELARRNGRKTKAGFFQKLLLKLVMSMKGKIIAGLSNAATQMAIKTILTDLDKRDLLKK